VRWVEQTGSTNDDLLAEAMRGAPDGTVLVADHQTSGHGRRGRGWEAPPGSSLLVSVLLRPEVDVHRLHLMTAAVGVAAAEAVEEVAGVHVGLKWPNDLVVPAPGEDRKLGGILAEVSWRGDHPDAVVVGLGLNVNWTEDLHPELAGIAIALNHLTGQHVDREALLEAFLDHLGPILDDLESVVERWRQRAATLGRRVLVELVSGEELTGTAVDLTEEGHLMVETEDGMRTVVAGDVHHLRPEA